MKIYTVTSDFFQSVQDLFHDVGTVEILPKNYNDIADFSADLIVFTGGEDINPKRYTNRPHNGHYNDKRDSWELKVFKDITKGALKTKKVLGICRGLQLINVALGGNLLYDIATKYGANHMGVHTLNHVVPGHMFSFLEMVNSMHHQCADSWGFSKAYPPKSLAVEPTTGTVEIMAWGNVFLGFQFHPEFFGSENPYRDQVANAVKDWVENNAALYPAEQPKKSPIKSNWDTVEVAVRRYIDIPAEPLEVEEGGF